MTGDGFEEWIRAQVDPTAPIELVHDRLWSQVLRVPTRDGFVFFKANMAPLAYEARVVELLAAPAPTA